MFLMEECMFEGNNNWGQLIYQHPEDFTVEYSPYTQMLLPNILQILRFKCISEKGRGTTRLWRLHPFFSSRGAGLRVSPKPRIN